MILAHRLKSPRADVRAQARKTEKLHQRLRDEIRAPRYVGTQKGSPKSRDVAHRGNRAPREITPWWNKGAFA